jgi:universal stress protein E
VASRRSARGGGVFRHILVDIDALAPNHPALDQAVDLAARADGRVTIVDVVEEVPAGARPYFSNRLEREIIGHRQALLDEAAARYRRRKIRIETAVLRGRPAIALVQYVLGRRPRPNLVVRSHARDLSPRRASFGAIDMQLLRKCPCPVWVVGVGERSRPRRILAAVHPDRDDLVEQALNRAIVEAGAAIAELEGGSLTVLHAWSPYGEALLEGRMSKSELRAFVGAARKGAEAQMDEFMARLGDDVKCEVELLKGEPDVVIPRYVTRRDIDMVVMGTVARTGLAGWIIGNTAEHMLQRLKCSVLALKPEGFVSPIPKAAR